MRSQAIFAPKVRKPPSNPQAIAAGVIGMFRGTLVAWPLNPLADTPVRIIPSRIATLLLRLKFTSTEGKGRQQDVAGNEHAPVNQEPQSFASAHGLIGKDCRRLIESIEIREQPAN